MQHHKTSATFWNIDIQGLSRK